MPTITASVPHQLSRSEAKRRIQEQIGVLRQRYAGVVSNVQESWTGDVMEFSVSALNQSIDGRLTVEDSAVHLSVNLPWLLSMLAKNMKPKIEQEARLLLGPPEKDAAPTPKSRPKKRSS